MLRHTEVLMSFFGSMTDINFPNIGISLNNVPQGITIFEFTIAFYGVVIAFGMLMGILVARWQAKRTGQEPEIYLDFALYAIILSVIGARLYFVIFEWDLYKDNLLDIFNLRKGGLAIYGGVIAGIITGVIYSKLKKIRFGLLADTGILGLLVGQIIGRWGNFFNREAFGTFTDRMLAMQINVKDTALSSVFKPHIISTQQLEVLYEGKEKALANILEIRNNIVTGVDGLQYIQVHPTFLYESLWNLALLIGLIIYSKHKKFHGEILLLYLLGYGAGRVWMEGLRTDQLFLWGTPFAVSQVLSCILVIGAAAILIMQHIRLLRNQSGKR